MATLAKTLQMYFLPLLKKMCDHEFGFVFAKPVDPAEWRIPEYKEVVERPMDLGTIQKRLANGRYTWQRPQRLHDDVCLVFQNAIKFAKPGQMIHGLATKMMADFEEEYTGLLDHMYMAEAKNRNLKGPDGNYVHCALCGGGTVLLQPPIFYCTVCIKKIPRNATYYSSRLGDSRPYCTTCYSKIKDKSVKDSLVQHRHTHTPEEGWIECEKCRRWYHHICGLFNPTGVEKEKAAAAAKAAANAAAAGVSANAAGIRTNATARDGKGKGKGKGKGGRKSKKAATAGKKRKGATTARGKKAAAQAAVQAAQAAAQAGLKPPAIEDNSNVHYTCPQCLYQERVQMGSEGPIQNLSYRGAKDLPITKMTTYIQTRISTFMTRHKNLWLIEKEALGHDPKNLDSRAFEDVYVRCVSNVERDYSPDTPAMKKNPLLLEWMRTQHNYTLDFKGRTKAILLFQEIDRVDVCFFAMSVLKPNQTLTRAWILDMAAHNCCSPLYLLC